MAKVTRNFTKGKMNKVVDERLVPNGEYIDALNIRMGSTEGSEIGVIENAKGNQKITNITYEGFGLSSNARCIGAFEDGVNETIYWFIHDSTFEASVSSQTGKLDLIVSFDTKTSTITYHVISINDGDNSNTTLNFDSDYLITGVDKVGDLLFWTDDLNPPRKINVTRNYANPSSPAQIDQFTSEELLVIKKPPMEAPELTMTTTEEQVTFLEERFICFAYRYKYEDNEYSATSQWTAPAFVPDSFSVSSDSYLNEGFVNDFNAVNITYNSGGPLVVGIDLLFKEADSNIIKIIDKIDKADLAGNNIDVTYNFTESKIFTILPESEILRLYDNVPRFAKAQTIMGNRLMYGNYVEGYDLTDSNGVDIRLDYKATLKSQSFDAELIDGTESTATYTIGGYSENVSNGQFDIDLSGIDLNEGTRLSFSFSFEHTKWNSNSVIPNVANADTSLSLDIQLLRNYSSVFDLINSAEFISIIGEDSTIQPIATASTGNTLTDRYNTLWASQLVSSAPAVTIDIDASGIDNDQEAIRVSNTSNVITFKFPTLKYVEQGTPSNIFYEYFKSAGSELYVNTAGTGRSLHSNRGYEVGMIYMDDFHRSTPAIVSSDNSLFVGCEASDTANSIKIEIPTTQKAPSWATRYKFAIKPDTETYETIYSNIFFQDPDDEKNVYFLLRGENSQKITEGQRLIVKSDTNGAINNCVYVTVLEKKAQETNFINPGIPVPAGVYMLIRANEFATDKDSLAVIDSGVLSTTQKVGNNYPTIGIPVVVDDPDNPGTWIEYDIPQGSTIKFDFDFERPGYGDGNSSCERRTYTLEKTMTATQDYASFEDWFRGDNIENVLNTGVPFVGGSGGTIGNEFLPSNNAEPFPTTTTTSVSINYYQFTNITLSPGLKVLSISGTKSCQSSYINKNLRSTVSARITVIRADDTIVFESEPLDAAPDIWYEGVKSYGIVNTDNACNFNLDVESDVEVGGVSSDIVFNYTKTNNDPAQVIVAPGNTATVVGVCGSLTIDAATTPDTPSDVTITSGSLQEGSHLGDSQNQSFTGGLSAICSPGFFNCFAFGNGVESYKVRDSLLGKTFNLGNRVTSTKAKDYKEVRRFADITYSGTFNDESNVNRLNEFNFGLLNFKPLEEIFGPIQKLFGRETDVLTLQEDKISYVLQGKNILSDASAGNLLTSVPEVLGQQIARIEEFGISFNPESFAVWGPDKYFTDAKRGVVLLLSGTSYSNDSLQVVSSFGMRTWFRDLFLVGFETQKLGGFDPYMNEYVLSSNDVEIPTEVACVDCGIYKDFTVSTAYDQCFDLGSSTGDVTVNWIVSNNDAPNTFNVKVQYDGNNYSALGETTSGSLTFPKSSISEEQAQIQVTTDPSNNLQMKFQVGCPQQISVTLVEVCVNNSTQAGLRIHNEHRYVSGDFTSPLTSKPVKLDTATTSEPAVSDWTSTLGTAGQGFIPNEGSVMTLAYNKKAGDTLDFDVAKNSLRYLVTSTLYSPIPSLTNALLSASSAVTLDITGAPNYYKGDFTVPALSNGDYIYVIYDYRQPNEVELCFGATVTEACCDCVLDCIPDTASVVWEVPTIESFVAVDLTSQECTITPTECANPDITFQYFEDSNYLLPIGNPSQYSVEDGTVIFVKIINGSEVDGCVAEETITINFVTP